jgi:hypothetical protein
MTKLVVAILLLALTMPASAEDMDIVSANSLLPGCKGYLNRESTPTTTINGASKAGACAGFVLGVGWAGSSIVCLPQGVTPSQMVAVVVKYIEARPERMHEQFGKLALEALTAAWPCKR